MTKYINETLATPLSEKTDVLVAGGGIAGIAAALSAARKGAKVTLIENQFALGGLATLGLIAIYLPLCDGEGHQVTFGICEELIRLSVKYGSDNGPVTPWIQGGTDEEKKSFRFISHFNPSLFCLESEKMLLDAGVEILYGTKVCSSVVSDGKISAVIIENKSGRSAIEVNSVIDATGDADVAFMSGAMTEINKEGNPLAAWYYNLHGGKRVLKTMGAADVPDDETADFEDDGNANLSNARFGGIDGKELSVMTQMSHSIILNDFKAQNKKDPDYMAIMIPTIPQVRETRRIVGLSTPDKIDRQRYEDSIGMISNWRRRGPIYEIPFTSLCSANISNLLAAGRDISVTDDLWDMTRVIPSCAITGEAAGIAAAMFTDFHKADVKKIQDELVNRGIKLHVEEVI